MLEQGFNNEGFLVRGAWVECKTHSFGYDDNEFSDSFESNDSISLGNTY